MSKIQKAWKPFRRFLADVRKEHLGLYAAQSSFFLIISMVPLLMLIFTMIQFIFPITQEGLTEFIHTYLPESLHLFAKNILADLFTPKTVSIVSLSTIMLLWSASRGIHSISQGIHHIFHQKESVYYKERLRSLVYTLALLLTIFFALIVLVFGNSLWNLAIRTFSWLAQSTFFVMFLKFGVSAILITLFSLLLYCACTTREQIKIVAQVPGALFTAAGWILFSTVFSLYLTTFSNYSYIYGSLAAIILLMLWFYFCMWILFLGAQINYSLSQRKNPKQMHIEEIQQ